jgi:hypothetical protein
MFRKCLFELKVHSFERSKLIDHYANSILIKSDLNVTILQNEDLLLSRFHPKVDVVQQNTLGVLNLKYSYNSVYIASNVYKNKKNFLFIPSRKTTTKLFAKTLAISGGRTYIGAILL